jgi:Bacterial lectin/Immunoglobulin I-set domain
MKNRLTLASSLSVFGAALALQMGVARADFNPVQLTQGSYTFSIVVPSNSPAPVPYCCTASQGGGTNLSDSTWFEQGFWLTPQTNIGVPHPGQIFTHHSNSNITYVMPLTYLTNNGLLTDSTGGGGTLTLVTPKTCSGLSIFGSSGGGNTPTINYTVTHGDASTETGTIGFPDWFNGPNPAWIAGGRVGMPGGGEQNNGSNPNLYSQEISVSSNSPVVSIGFTFGSGGTPAVYAISATTDGTTYTPVAVTGYNYKLIVPKSFPLNATMDTGTNVSDTGEGMNTWFESGFVTNNTNWGLPPSGSIFNSFSQPTHHYQMGSYFTNNAILIDTNHLSANITPAAPAPFSAFALLTAGGNIGGGNKMTNLCIFQHQDGVQETNVFFGYDWFEGSVPGFIAYKASGRVNMEDRTINNNGNSFPYLFETYFPLVDTGSPVTNILLKFVTTPSANATTFIMAVSASSGGIPPVIQTQPQWVDAFLGHSAHFGITMGVGTSPQFFWQKASSPTGPYTTLTDGGNISGSATTNLSIANVGPGDAGWYQIIVSNAVGIATSTPPVALYELTSTLPNILLPGDSISDSSFFNNTPSNPGEGVSNILDGSTSKYLCFGAGPTNGGAPFVGPVGFVVTPGLGNTVVSAMRIYTANDAPERDPIDIMLEGSTNGGGSWTTILADTPLSLPNNRNAGGLPINATNQPLQELDFANTNGYTSYRVTINNVKTNAIANSMQVAEIQMLGFASGPPVVAAPFSLPENNVAVVGGTTTLHVIEGGTAPLTNQWTLNGTNIVNGSRISGAQSATLVISNVQFSDAGYYQLNITNGAGAYSVYPGGGADQNLDVIAVPTFLTNGLGWTANSNPATNLTVIQNNVLEMTYNGGGSARSFFFDSPMYIGAFQASFTYWDTTGGGADGITFCLQNDPRGPAALGGTGGQLGVSGITPSAELTFNIYSGSPGGVGISFATGGGNGSPYSAPGSVNIASGDPILVTVLYENGVARLTLNDTNANTSFSTALPIGNLPALLGGQTAYVGFTGADGGVSSIQTITDFSYVPLATLSVKTSGLQTVISWPAVPGGFSLQSKSSLTSGTWQNVAAPVTQAGGQNQVTVPIAGASQFFRLYITLPAQ